MYSIQYKSLGCSLKWSVCSIKCKCAVAGSGAGAVCSVQYAVCNVQREVHCPNGSQIFTSSISGSRSDSEYLAVPGPVLELNSDFIMVSGSLTIWFMDPVLGSCFCLNS